MLVLLLIKVIVVDAVVVVVDVITVSSTIVVCNLRKTTLADNSRATAKRTRIKSATATVTAVTHAARESSLSLTLRSSARALICHKVYGSRCSAGSAVSIAAAAAFDFKFDLLPSMARAIVFVLFAAELLQSAIILCRCCERVGVCVCAGYVAYLWAYGKNESLQIIKSIIIFNVTLDLSIYFKFYNRIIIN